ncbi:hypothetical protein WME98_10945 [Sorangium sp. So ce296]|uniref:hypothetical protein n=1 Tax=Sorangium sp. So ce296 TaxID=3133296 RepID=UPI003F5EAF5B
MSTTWYEVWANDGLDVPYILILRPTDRGLEILEPAQGNRRVFSTEKFDEAKYWLGEDEFVFVARKEIDEP